MNIIKARRGRKVVSRIAIAVIALTFAVIPASRSAFAAAPSEQVVFSGFATTNDGVLGVGFWIWCQPEGNSPIYSGACQGAIQIPGHGPATPVAGFIVENPDGTYVARVFSKKANSFLVAAAFHNVNPEPEQGPNNVVQFGILTDDLVNRVGVATNAVVNVTGPGD